MQNTIYIDQPFAIRHELKYSEAAVYGFFTRLPGWAEFELIGGQPYYFASRNMVCTELPLVTEKPDTMYRIYKALETKGLVYLEKSGAKDMVRLDREIAAEWNNKDYSEKFPTLGKKSESLGNLSESTRKKIRKTSEKNPTYSVEYYSVEKEGGKPAIAAPSILKSVQSEPDETVEDSAADFIARHSAPRNDFSPFTTAPLPAFQGGTEEDYQSIYSRIADSLNGGNNWASIAALAKCTMTGAQFKDELQTWIRYYMSKPHLYNKPVQSLRGGPISFVNWLNKPWAQEKYNPQVKAKQIQEQRRSPVRRQISTLA